MSLLPIPAKMYFDDFSFELLEYSLIRNSETISNLNGLIDSDEDGKHIKFLIGPDIKINDVLSSGNKSYTISSISFDTFNGSAEIIKAYF